MARTPTIDEAQYVKLVEIARSLGFDTDKLIRRK
jgi:lipocalin